MKGFRVTKNIKVIKFEEGWGQLKLKKIFPRHKLTKYLRLTIVFIGNSVEREKFNFYFSRDLFQY